MKGIVGAGDLQQPGIDRTSSSFLGLRRRRWPARGRSPPRLTSAALRQAEQPEKKDRSRGPGTGVSSATKLERLKGARFGGSGIQTPRRSYSKLEPEISPTLQCRPARQPRNPAMRSARGTSAHRPHKITQPITDSGRRLATVQPQVKAAWLAVRGRQRRKFDVAGSDRPAHTGPAR